MSWQAYIDSSLLGSGSITKAAIIGHDGSVWAASEGFTVKPEEASTILKGYSDASVLTTSGIKLNGEKYFYIRSDDRTINGKLGEGGVFCVKTGMSIIIGVYDDTVKPGQASIVVEKLADYLIDAGYHYIIRNLNTIVYF
ncbi:profilin-like protein [Neoconidiobolus thromboides FSU 785]|nr:profilin-like protein [Neoconidiobolus thromboides FSU 785]